MNFRAISMQFLLKIFALLLLPIGLVSLMLPIPGAFLVLVLGMTLLIATSRKTRICLSCLRLRYDRFNLLMVWLEERTGERMGAVLKQTRPVESEEV